MFRQIVRVRMPQCSSYIWAKVIRRKAYSVIFFSVDCTYKNDSIPSRDLSLSTLTFPKYEN